MEQESKWSFCPWVNQLDGKLQSFRWLHLDITTNQQCKQRLGMYHPNRDTTRDRNKDRKPTGDKGKTGIIYRWENRCMAWHNQGDRGVAEGRSREWNNQGDRSGWGQLKAMKQSSWQRRCLFCFIDFVLCLFCFHFVGFGFVCLVL